MLRAEPPQATLPPTQRQVLRRRACRWLAALLLAGCVAGRVPLHSAPGMPEFVSDKLRLVAVTTAATPPYDPANWFQRAARPFPDWLQKWVRVPEVPPSQPISPGNLGLWVARARSSSAESLGQLSAVCVDRHGCRFREDLGFAPEASEHASLLELTHRPRRESLLHGTLIDADGQTLGRFALPAPAEVTASRWQPARLPIRQPKGDLEFELRKVEVYSSTTPWEEIAGPARLLAEVRVRRRGRSLPGWKITGTIVSDETGNSYEETSGRPYSGLYLDSGAPCPWEPAWKLRCTVVPPPECDYAPADTWVLEDVPLPADGQVTRFQARPGTAGHPVRRACLGGPGRFTYVGVRPQRKHSRRGVAPGTVFANNGGTFTGVATDQRRTTFRSDLPHVVLELPRIHTPGDMVLSARDQIGRPVFCGFDGAPASAAEGTAVWLLDPLPGTRRVTLRWAVRHPVQVEYLFRPPLPAPARSLTYLDPTEGTSAFEVTAYRAKLRRLLPSAQAASDLACSYCEAPEALRSAAEALRLARAAAAAQPDQPATQQALGKALYRTGDWNGARRLLRRSWNASADWAGTDCAFLAMSCARLRRRDEACFYLRQYSQSLARWTPSPPEGMLLLQDEAAALITALDRGRVAAPGRPAR